MNKLSSLLVALPLFSLIFFAFYTHTPDITQDLGRHVVLGEYIVTHSEVPKTNILSYTNTEFPFINHHWLSEVIFYFVYKAGGSIGLQMLSGFLAVLAFASIYFTALRKSNLLILMVSSLLFLGILFQRIYVRPELFSFFFLSLFVSILSFYREKYTKWVFLLIPLELLWVNMHIYFITGVIIVGMFVMDELWRERKNIHGYFAKKERLNHHTRMLALCFSGVIVATLCNPNGLHGALYPFTVFTNYGLNVGENFTIFYHQTRFNYPAIIFFEVAAITLILGLLLNYKKTTLLEWLISISFIILGASSLRNMPLFVFAAFPLFTSVVTIFYKTVRKKQKIIKHIGTPFLCIVIVVLFFLNIGIISKSNADDSQVKKDQQAAVDFFEENQLTGPIFNNFESGDYLSYRLFPDEKVFIDARPEAYPVSFIQQVYVPMHRDNVIFKREDSKYHFNTLFLTYTASESFYSLIKNRISDREWQLVYLNSEAVIFVKKDEKNKRVIEKFAITPDKLRVDDFTTNNIQALYRLAVIFNTFGWYPQEEAIHTIILTRDPNNCIALTRIIGINEGKNETLTPYLLRYQQVCGQKLLK